MRLESRCSHGPVAGFEVDLALTGEGMKQVMHLGETEVRDMFLKGHSRRGSCRRKAGAFLETVGWMGISIGKEVVVSRTTVRMEEASQADQTVVRDILCVMKSLCQRARVGDAPLRWMREVCAGDDFRAATREGGSQDASSRWKDAMRSEQKEATGVATVALCGRRGWGWSEAGALQQEARGWEENDGGKEG